MMDSSENQPLLKKLFSNCSYQTQAVLANQFSWGRGLCAPGKGKILLTEPGDYIKIGSGLGGKPPLNVVFLCYLRGRRWAAVLELASPALCDIRLTFKSPKRDRAEYDRV